MKRGRLWAVVGFGLIAAAIFLAVFSAAARPSALATAPRPPPAPFAPPELGSSDAGEAGDEEAESEPEDERVEEAPDCTAAPRLDLESQVRVLDATGSPVAGALVRWEARDGIELCDGGFESFFARAQTNGSGEAATKLPNNSTALFAERGADSAMVNLWPTGEAVQKTTLVLAPGGGLVVKVVDETGKPIEGARLALALISLRRTTDARGVVDFGALPVGDYFVSAQAEGFAPLGSEDITLRAGRPAQLTLTLARGTALTVRVRRAGRACEDATVTVGGAVVHTDDAGVALFPHVALGPLQLGARWVDDGGVSFEASEKVNVEGPSERTLALEARTPVKRCKVTGQAMGDDGTPLRTSPVALWCGDRRAGVTDDGGNFELEGSESPACLLDVAGTSTQVACPGVARIVVSSCTLRVEVAGLSTDPYGVDRINRVSLLGPGGNTHSQPGLPATFQHLAAGSYEVYARTRLGSGRAQVTLKPLESRTLELPVAHDGWKVSGRVVSAATGQPIALATAVVTFPGGLGGRDTLMQSTDDTGHFTFEQVAAGTVIIGARARGHIAAFGRRTLQTDIDVGEMRVEPGVEASPSAAALGYALKADGLQFIVFGVKPGSPADRAGLKDADILLSVDGLDISGFELDEVEAVHAGMASRPVALRIRRGSTDRTVQLPRQ